MVCFITYDLNSEGQNYEDVIKTIKDCAVDGKWYSCWRSSYLIKTDMKVDEINDKIHQYLDKNDTLFVVEVTSNYQGWINKKDWDFVNKEIFS
ncbi:MAG TPA: hypothetical protein IAA03_03820 [Candidatus Ruminococcus avistercoris]|nr:hypothetical protein [Candidatus Ruminococcus avistercoris]